MTAIKRMRSAFTIESILGNHLTSDNQPTAAEPIITPRRCDSNLKDFKDHAIFTNNLSVNEVDATARRSFAYQTTDQQLLTNNNENAFAFNEIYKPPTASLMHHYLNADLSTNFAYLQSQFLNNGVTMPANPTTELTASSLYWKSRSPQQIIYKDAVHQMLCTNAYNATNYYNFIDSRIKRKGGQIRFSFEQTKQLEYFFANAKYLTPEERRHLAMQLKLSDRQVKTWFQNRRAKWRRFNQLKYSYTIQPVPPYSMACRVADDDLLPAKLMPTKLRCCAL
uniref:Homeobox domain-containing protein n=1 Tax=Glossina palpalis gambiensis TaxID=67801 RepID=A0A1B0BKM9_9MUSC